MRTSGQSILNKVILILLVMVATASGAVIKGEVYLTDGTTYLGVTIKVNNEYKIIQIDSASVKRSVSFHMVALILDKNGNDITRSVIGRDSRDIVKKPPSQERSTPDSGQIEPEPESREGVPDTGSDLTNSPVASTQDEWLSETDPKVVDYNRSLWSVALWSHGTYSNPMGYYYDGIDAGSNLGFGLSIAINRKMALRFDIERSGMQPGNAFNLVSINPNEVEIVSQKHEMSTNRYLIGIQFIDQSSEPGETLQMFHATTGLGGISHNFRSSVTLREVSSGAVATFSDELNESKFMTYISGGAVIGLSETMGIDIGLNLDMIWVGSDGKGSVQRAYIFDLRFGLVFLIK